MPSDFWANVFSNFMGSLGADAIAATGLAFFLNWLAKQRTKPNAIIRANLQRTSTSRIVLNLFLHNSGKVAFRSEEILWSVYFPAEDGELECVLNEGNSTLIAPTSGGKIIAVGGQ